ncbi:uncharacterized protein [Watersipora subatra]|uniref:uncharacterized protein n=1 Tax=Watersipora subatra TaxID=2589382 RepID=UPI00355C99CF
MSSTRSVTQIIIFAIILTACGCGGASTCIPVQWECQLLGMVMVNGPNESYTGSVIGQMAEDYTSNGQALLQKVYVNGKLYSGSLVVRSLKGTYLADTINKKCTRFPPTKFERYCTNSSTLTYFSSWTLGSQLTDTYSVKGYFPHRYLTMFRETFTPCTQNTQTSTSGVDELMTLQYANLTKEIKDRSIFDVPDYCTAAKRRTQFSPEFYRLMTVFPVGV